jgi:hypothetical protein
MPSVRKSSSRMKRGSSFAVSKALAIGIIDGKLHFFTNLWDESVS